MADILKYDLSLYPQPILRQRAEPVATFDQALAATVAAMFATMYAEKGVGLAAPQVGRKQRILVLNPTGEQGAELALVNVTITERSGAPTKYEEGCLSFPGIYAEVERPERCKVVYQDLTGQRIEREFEGFVSRIVQHEYDHLEGVLLVDRMSPADRVRNKAALEELVHDYKRARASQTRVSK